MKYLLMITMFASCVIIGVIANRSKKDREYLLKRIKDSIKSSSIKQYIDSLNNKENGYLPVFKKYIDDVANKRDSVPGVAEKIMDTCAQVFKGKNDQKLLRIWLNQVIDEKDDEELNVIEVQCNELIAKTVAERNSNMYIAIAAGVVLMIIVI